MSDKTEEMATFLKTIERGLYEMHSQDPSIFTVWASNPEQFVKDHMELVRAAYAGGVLDAMEDLTDSINTIKHAAYTLEEAA